jgi:hypothetical protein
MISKFTAALKNYINEGQLEHNGLPTVAQLAQQLFVSPRYLSDY